jgi:hypothetical protein
MRRIGIAVVLSIRLHRFEVGTVVLLMMLAGIAGVIVPGRLQSVGVPDECFAREGTPACRSVLETFFAIRRDEASWMMGIGAGLFPVLLGLIVGAPLVARELEHRTAALAWSLTGRRSRWLLDRVLGPMLLLVAGTSLLGLLAGALLDAAYPTGLIPALDQLGSQGPTFVARAVMAFGMALLVGAILGRSLGALLVAGILALAMATVGVQALYAITAQTAASWRPAEVGWLIELRERYRWPDGRLATREEIEAIENGEPSPDDWIASNLQREVYGLPDDDFQLLESLETLVAGGIGVAAVVLTFPVVARRRVD